MKQNKDEKQSKIRRKEKQKKAQNQIINCRHYPIVSAIIFI